MTHNNEKAHGCDPVGFQINTTNAANSGIKFPICKELWSRFAMLALDGYEAQLLEDGAFLVRNHQSSHYCCDKDALLALVKRLGAHHD